MALKTTRERARKDLREGKRPSEAAGEFVREEMAHVRRGKHGASSPKPAMAIGLDKARRSGVSLPPKESHSRTSSAATSSTKREPRAAAAAPAMKREPRATAADQSRRRTTPSSSRSTMPSAPARSQKRGARKK
ncbi:MAG TPA: hypothetical protein VIC33_03820 [Vicinamibacterales bacterium]|jgi:hypothetical protein